MNLKKIKINTGVLGNLGSFIKQNGSTLSMIGSFVCLGASLYAAFKASDEVHDIHINYVLDVEDMRSEGLETPEKAKELKGTRNIRYIFAYRYVILFGLGAAGLTFLTHWLDGLALGGLTTALALERDKVKKFIENGKETFGEAPWQEVEDKTLEDIISERFFGEDEPKWKLLDDKNGDVVVVDSEDGDGFQLNYDDLKKIIDYAEEASKKRWFSKAEFYTKFFGISDPEQGKRPELYVKGWGPDNPFKVHLGKRKVFGGDWLSLEYDNHSKPRKSYGTN